MAEEPKKKRAVRKVRVAFVRSYELVEKACRGCGATYAGTRQSRYCSPECRGRSAWRRNGPGYLERKADREKQLSQQEAEH